MKYTLIAAIIFFVAESIRCQPVASTEIFSARAQSFSFVATADEPADIQTNPALLATARGQNFSYSIFLNEANAPLEHHFQITGAPLLPLLSYRRASAGSAATVTNFYSLGTAIGGKGGGIGFVIEWFSGDLTEKQTEQAYHLAG
ncbi:MAG: hypothetical protein ONA90_08025, partial [candidate division KSB1 bacterium]|nr:hypothetical protein [candidate division KSB1 bacterium]